MYDTCQLSISTEFLLRDCQHSLVALLYCTQKVKNYKEELSTKYIIVLLYNIHTRLNYKLLYQICTYACNGVLAKQLLNIHQMADKLEYLHAHTVLVQYLFSLN